MKKLLKSFRDSLQSKPLGRLHFFTQLDSRVFRSFSGFGEDAILVGIIKRYKFLTGTDYKFSYLDIGAFKPKKSSNTYALYKLGFKGTAVEPNPQLETLWKSTRPHDIFRGIACGDGKDKELQFFGPSAESNSLSKEFTAMITKHQKLEQQESVLVKTETLDQIVANHLERIPGNFFLDLDIEGLDLEVLEHFSFMPERRAFLLMVEDFSAWTSEERGVNKLLISKGYLPIAKTIISTIYIDKLSHFYESMKDSEY